MDHIYMKDWFGNPGVGNYTSLFAFTDHKSDIYYPVPVESKTAIETQEAINHIRGNNRIRRIYCDGAPEFKSACRSLGIFLSPGNSRI